MGAVTSHVFLDTVLHGLLAYCGSGGGTRLPGADFQHERPDPLLPHAARKRSWAFALRSDRELRMHLARRVHRVFSTLAATAVAVFALAGVASADKIALLGSNGTSPSPVIRTITSETGAIVAVDPGTVPCSQITTFSDLAGGDTPGTNYEGPVFSQGMTFGERFLGQTLGAIGDFDAVSGSPSDPLTLQAGALGQNLDVLSYSTNVLTGLGPLGFPDIDAIGEGSIAMAFPLPQERVSFQLVGGNGGSATLTFYGADGSLLDTIVITGLAEASYGFETADATNAISGILIQTTDPSGIGVDNICREGAVVPTRAVSWGAIKTLYR